MYQHFDIRFAHRVDRHGPVTGDDMIGKFVWTAWSGRADPFPHVNPPWEHFLGAAAFDISSFGAREEL
jgi:hypothetical protein